MMLLFMLMAAQPVTGRTLVAKANKSVYMKAYNKQLTKVVNTIYSIAGVAADNGAFQLPYCISDDDKKTYLAKDVRDGAVKAFNRMSGLHAYPSSSDLCLVLDWSIP